MNCSLLMCLLERLLIKTFRKHHKIAFLIKVYKRTHLANVTRFSPSACFTTWIFRDKWWSETEKSSVDKAFFFLLFNDRWKHNFFIVSLSCVCINPFFSSIKVHNSVKRKKISRKISAVAPDGKEEDLQEWTKLSGRNRIHRLISTPSSWLHNVLFSLYYPLNLLTLFLFISSPDCSTTECLSRRRRSKWLYKWFFEHK